jgi:transglutaminase-like putative cysteine protease
LTPEGTVKAANEIAAKYAPDAPIRTLAAQILRGCSNVPKDGPTRIACWIKENILYLQESPGREVLQGPYHTLPAGLRVGDFEFSGCGAGDCDDLSILFACLCRSAGLEAFACGVAELPYTGSFVHCIGYSGTNGKFYELSQDETYGGIPGKPLVLDAPPVGQMGKTYDPVRHAWKTYKNNPQNPAFSYSVGAEGLYSQSRMAGTTAQSQTPLDAGTKAKAILGLLVIGGIFWIYRK